MHQSSIVELLEGVVKQPQVTLKVTQESKDVIRVVSEYKGETSEQKLVMLLINGADGMRLSSWEFTAKDSTEDGTGARRSSLRLKWKKYAGVWYISEAISEGAGVHDGLRSEGRTTVTIREFTPNVEIEDKEFTLDGLDIPPGAMVNDQILDTRYRYAGSKGDAADKLRKLSRAAQMYANDYDNKFPDTMQQLKQFLDEKELKWMSDNVCYLGKGKTVLDLPEIPLAYDKTMLEAEQGKGTNVLFVSGIVSFRAQEQLKKLGITAGPKTDVQVEARVSESKAEKHEGKTIDEWISRWDSELYDDIREATEALTRIGRPAVPAMIEEVKKGGSHASYARTVLGKMGPAAEEAIDWLIETALDKDATASQGWKSTASYRVSVVYSLGLMRWASDRLISVFKTIAEDDEDDTNVRKMAIFGLKNIGKEAMPILKTVAGFEQIEIRNSARNALAGLLEKEQGLTKKGYYTQLIEQDPFDASVPEYLGHTKGIVNQGRPHLLTQEVKKLYRERVRDNPDPELAWRLATIIQYGLQNTELMWAAPTDGSKGRSPREDPTENYTTLAEVLQLGFDHAESGSQLQRQFGTSLAKLRLLQGDWDRMNAMLQKLGQEPIPKESRQWLHAPPVDWEEGLRSQWKIADESMRSGNCSLEFKIEKAGKGLKGVHILVKRAPEPTNVINTSISIDTLFFAPSPMKVTFGSFGYKAKDRPMTRYAVSDESGIVRFDKLPYIPVKIEVLVPTSNFPEAASNWDLWMEVEPGKFKIAKKYGAGAINTQVPPAVVELKEGQTVHYPNLVVRPAFSLNVKDWDRVDMDSFTLSWQGLAPSMQTQNTEYELEMYLSAPGSPHYQATNAPVVRSAKQLTKDTQWPVSAQGVGNLHLEAGNIYMFELRAIDASGTIIARWPRTRVWVPWAYRQSNPPFTGHDTYANSPIHHGLWHSGSFGYGDGRKETLREKVARFLRDYPDAFEYEYARMGKAWLDWRDGDREGARRRLEKLVKELPKGNVARGTALWLIQQIDENKDPPKRLNFVPDRETSRSKAVSLPDEKTEVQIEVERSSGASEATSATLTVPEAAKTRGGISGVVVSSATGKPITGAYVGVGDFGDSGGSNYSRHRSQGFHDKTKTDEKGRFELDGLAFTDDHPYLKVHPLVVTHPDFVRHDEKIELPRDGPAPDVKVSLRPAAKIDVTIVDAQGNPLKGHWLLRLEALDGRRFISPGSDPHLSSFASSVWMKLPDLRRNMGTSEGFSFTELDTGEYLIEAIRLHLVDKPTPQKIWESSITYHGAIAKLKVEAGRTKQVQIKPANHQTAVTLKMPESPEMFSGKQEIPRLLTISRKLGLMLWDTNKAYGLEDPRLGRLQKNAFFYTLVPDSGLFTIKNLPPGSYCVFAGPVMCMSAAKVDVVRGRQTTIQIPKVQFDGTAASVGVWTFDRKVKLETRDYSVSELCELLTEITQSNPRIIADSSIENVKLRFDKGEMSIWDVLEKLYLDKGWKVDEGEEKTLIIQPAEENRAQTDVEKPGEKFSQLMGADLPDSVQNVKFLSGSFDVASKTWIKFDIPLSDLKNLLTKSAKLPDFPDLHKNPKIQKDMDAVSRDFNIEWWKSDELESPVCAAWIKSSRIKGHPGDWMVNILNMCCSQLNNNLMRVYISFYSHDHSFSLINPDVEREIEDPEVWSQELAGDVFAAVRANDNNKLKALTVDKGLLTELQGYRRDFDCSGFKKMVHYQKADRCFVIISPVRHKDGKGPGREIRFGFELEQRAWKACSMGTGSIGTYVDFLKKEGFNVFSEVEITREFPDTSPLNSANNSTLQVDVEGAGKNANMETQTLSFDPVVDCVVHAIDTEKDSFIDFDTGKYFNTPKKRWLLFDFDVRNRHHRVEWAKKTGADAAVRYSTGGGTLVMLWSYDVAAKKVEPYNWQDLRAEQVVQYLSKATHFVEEDLGHGHLRQEPPDTTHIFRTREGGVGIIQIAGFTNNPKGVKIRYKMVQKESAGKTNVKVGGLKGTS
ncbi:MAG TPA: hypothetical protein VMY06_02320 [Sedimentisphaerales bacterium]|nr:hypothetical protein [Sedimentisphaerales bacterium]